MDSIIVHDQICRLSRSGGAGAPLLGFAKASGVCRIKLQVGFEQGSGLHGEVLGASLSRYQVFCSSQVTPHRTRRGPEGTEAFLCVHMYVHI